MCLYLTACTDKAIIVDEMPDIPKAIWAFNQIPDFDFDVKNIQLNHNLYLNLKIQKTYPYENLYLLTHIKDTEGKITSSRKNFRLTDEDGNPIGSMSGNSISYQLPIFTNMKFQKSGKYFIALEQNMRDDILENVVSVGVRVEFWTSESKAW